MCAIWYQPSGEQSTLRVRIHRPWHRHNSPTVGRNGSFAKEVYRQGRQGRGQDREYPLKGRSPRNCGCCFRKATQRGRGNLWPSRGPQALRQGNPEIPEARQARAPPPSNAHPQTHSLFSFFLARAVHRSCCVGDLCSWHLPHYCSLRKRRRSHSRRPRTGERRHENRLRRSDMQGAHDSPGGAVRHLFFPRRQSIRPRCRRAQSTSMMTSQIRMSTWSAPFMYVRIPTVALPRVRPQRRVC